MENARAQTSPQGQHNPSVPPPPYAAAPPQQLGSQDQPGNPPPAYPYPAAVSMSAQLPGYPPNVFTGNQPLPPPYCMDQTPQQQLAYVVVVGAQPSAMTSTVVRHPTGDNFMTLSLILTFLCVVCGGWPSLLCTTIAIIMASAAKDNEAAGNPIAARKRANIALALNIGAVLSYIALVVSIITPIVVTHAFRNYY